MGMQIGCKKPVLCSDCDPGMYVSENGSVVIMPEQNMNTDGGDYNGKPKQCLVTDVDTGRTFIKDIDKLKGKYSFKCNLENIQLSCNECDDAGCCDL
jgi:hypothetical protein